jgi:hypothetical protein
VWDFESKNADIHRAGWRIMSGSSVQGRVLVPVHDLLSSIHFVPSYIKASGSVG